ncbi:MAG TPA: class I SAM-dependent methyltransferase, partial [Candidatus Heimdallarchaeota archaeon]|nr:class I SAM-dependent methyltransferase [Candidatus Heimdallarchaeota archaeon]
TGAQCRLLARAGMAATGVDLSEAMIVAARRHGGRNVRYLHGSAFHLPFAKGSFDASLLLLALHEHNEEERGLMLVEALRVVRPDGYLLIADYTVPNYPSFHIPWQTIRLIEGLAGAEHRAGFRDFVARGGLAGLLTRHELAPAHKSHSHSGAIGIAVI